jgi:hypothetical protein
MNIINNIHPLAVCAKKKVAKDISVPKKPIKSIKASKARRLTRKLRFDIKSSAAKSKKLLKAKNKAEQAKLNNPKLELLIPVFANSTSLKPEVISEYFQKVTSYHDSLIGNLGVKFGTKHFKDIFQYCLVLCEGGHPEPLSRVSVGRKDRWPNKLGFLRPVFRQVLNNDLPQSYRAELLRLLLTLSKVNKICSAYSEVDIENIQLTFSISQVEIDKFNEYISLNVKNSEDSLQNLAVTPFMGSSNGPNGVPKLESAEAEAAALFSSNMHKHFKVMCDLTDNGPFYDFFKATAEKFIENNPKYDLTKVKLRRLSAVPDSGNKSRTVAICDFWTQTLLQPLEKAIERSLLNEFGDKSAFLSHSQGWDDISTWEDTGNIHSIDATAWTDNFPAHYQFLVMKQKFGQQYAVAWQQIAVKCAWNVGSTDKTINYGKGQGMGTKGSFLIASYSDHLWIESKLMEGYQEVKNYKKVGDDLVITDPQGLFYKFYEEIGVPINRFKSKSCIDGVQFVEFVSRNSIDGYDYSAISCKLAKLTNKQPFLILTYLAHIKERLPNQFLPPLDVLLNTAGVPQKEVDKIKYLIESYQKVLGLDIIDVQNVEDFGLDYNLILLDLLNQVVEDTLGVHIDELSEDNIDKARDMVRTMISNEYHDIWDSAVKENWSLKDIKFLNYGEVLLTKVMEQKLFEINEGHTDLFESIFDNNSERSIETVHSVVDTEVAKAILDIARTARCNRESIKIFGDINELLNRDHSAQVQMFKQINATMKSCVSRNYCLDESQKSAFRRLGLLECHEFLFNTLVENGTLEHDGSVFKDCLTEVWHSCFTKK